MMPDTIREAYVNAGQEQVFRFLTGFLLPVRRSFSARQWQST